MEGWKKSHVSKISFRSKPVIWSSDSGSSLMWTVLDQTGRIVKLNDQNNWNWTVIHQTGLSQIKIWAVWKAKTGRSSGMKVGGSKDWKWAVYKLRSGRSKQMNVDGPKGSRFWTHLYLEFRKVCLRIPL